MAVKKFFCFKCAHHVGMFLILLFLICFFWFKPADLSDLHLDLLRMAFIGFDDFNVKSFILGLLQSYVWAYIGVGLWYLTGCCMRKCECKK